MPAITEIIPGLAEGALVLAPALGSVPVLGRLLVLISSNHGNETEALRKLTDAAKERETKRKTRQDQNARYVIKASEAMKCAEDAIANANLLLDFGRALITTLAGRQVALPDIILERIYMCIEENVLRQDTPRVKRTKTYWKRPS